MENKNFSAKDLVDVKYQLSQLAVTFEGLHNAANCGYNDPHDGMYNNIKSEDSDLAQAWLNSAELTIEFHEKADKLINKIQNEITRYMTATVENETTTSEAVSSINGSLESNKDALSQIDF